MFCPNGASDNFSLTSGSTHTTSLANADAETGAIRVNLTSGIVYMAFGPSATTSDLKITQAGSEVFRIPAGATDVSFAGAASSSVCVTIGEKL